MSRSELEILRELHLTKLREIDSFQINAYPLYDVAIRKETPEMPVLVRIKTGELPPDHQRDPVEMCVILDRSGSMQDRLSDCKVAIKQLVDKMILGDTISIVIYDDYSEIIVLRETVNKKEEILRKINSVVARGCTNMFDAIQKGVSILGKDDRQKIIFLFSDGISNRGLTGDNIGMETQKLVQGINNLSIMTYGIGNEFNEKLMSSIASVGHGHYYYIDHIERVSYLLDKGMSGNTRFWDKNAILTGKSEENLELPEKTFKLRELTVVDFIYYLSPSAKSCEITFTLKAAGNVMNCIARWVYDEMLMSFPNPQVKSYLTIKECAEINEDIDVFIENTSQIKYYKLLKKYKQKIVDKYSKLVDDDECVMIRPLLEKEKEFISSLREPMYNQASAVDIKLFQRSAMANGNYGGGVSSYVDSDDDSDDGDMGYGLFD